MSSRELQNAAPGFHNRSCCTARGVARSSAQWHAPPVHVVERHQEEQVTHGAFRDNMPKPNIPKPNIMALSITVTLAVILFCWGVFSAQRYVRISIFSGHQKHTEQSPRLLNSQHYSFCDYHQNPLLIFWPYVVHQASSPRLTHDRGGLIILLQNRKQPPQMNLRTRVLCLAATISA